jgi:nitrite reductase/ring-hydroxylating ferredoxin subunit
MDRLHTLGLAPQGRSATPELRVVGAARLAHGETHVFELDYLGRKREAFVLRHGDTFHAYLNECPHWAVELDLGDGHFFDAELDMIYCKNHGAIFSPSTGRCESGPCLGRSLDQFVTRVDGGDVIVSITAPAADAHRAE